MGLNERLRSTWNMRWQNHMTHCRVSVSINVSTLAFLGEYFRPQQLGLPKFSRCLAGEANPHTLPSLTLYQINMEVSRHVKGKISGQ